MIWIWLPAHLCAGKFPGCLSVHLSACPSIWLSEIPVCMSQSKGGGVIIQSLLPSPFFHPQQSWLPHCLSIPAGGKPGAPQHRFASEPPALERGPNVGWLHHSWGAPGPASPSPSPTSRKSSISRILASWDIQGTHPPPPWSPCASPRPPAEPPLTHRPALHAAWSSPQPSCCSTPRLGAPRQRPRW